MFLLDIVFSIFITVLNTYMTTDLLLSCIIVTKNTNNSSQNHSMIYNVGSRKAFVLNLD